MKEKGWFLFVIVEWKCIQPYSFQKTIRSLLSDDEPLYREKDGRLYRAIHGDQGPLLLSFEENKTKDGIKIRIDGLLEEKEKNRLVARLTNMLAVKKDVTLFNDRFLNDPYIGKILESRKGMHWVLTPTVFECLITTVISQQLHRSFATTLKRRLIALVGEKATFQDQEYPLFPKAEQIAQLQVTDLRKQQFSQRKAEYILDISRRVASGQMDVENFDSYSNEEIFDQCLSIRGIGKWTIECLLIFGLGRQDILPAADIGLRNAIQKVYQLKERPSEEKVRQIGQSWKPFRSYVTYYLWDVLSNGIGGEKNDGSKEKKETGEKSGNCR